MNLWCYNKLDKKFGILTQSLDSIYCFFKPYYGRNPATPPFDQYIHGIQYITNSKYLTDIFIWEE